MSLRLSLLIALFATLWSCRNDYFPDQQENPNDRNALRYTYKRISLDESKHKTNLIPELKKVNEKFKTLETYVSGKAVKYSNGVSVNTDDVIYIERGPNVHSYTFHLTRDNAAEDAPLENLVLSLLPDGTYKELLITYHFTLQEKQILANGGSVDTKGKLTVEELNPGTYNGGLVGKSDISCEWIEESYFTSCSEGQHFNGELPKTQGGPCKADQPSTMVTVVIHRCKALPATTGLGDDGTGGGGGPFGGSGGNNNGTPTIPNLPLPNIPCKKIKKLLANPKTIAIIDDLKKHLAKGASAGEKGWRDNKMEEPTETTQNSDHSVNFGDPSTMNGGYHTHQGTGVNIFSATDVATLIEVARYQAIGDASNGYMGVMAPGGIHYVMYFNGSQSDIPVYGSYNEKQLQDWNDQQWDQYLELLSDDNITNNERLELILFTTLKKMGVENRVNLLKIDSNNIGNIIFTISQSLNGAIVTLPCN